MLEKIDKMILESSPAKCATVLQSDLLFIFFFKGTMWFTVECSRLNLLYHVVNRVTLDNMVTRGNQKAITL